MGNLLLVIVTIIYLGVAVDYSTKGHIGMTISFIAYAIANIGFILANRGM